MQPDIKELAGLLNMLTLIILKNYKELFKEKLNNESIALFRFADDCFIFANSEQVIEKILTKII